MIHLDTNYLINLLADVSPEAQHVRHWLSTRETLAASAIVWTEFLNGPVSPVEVTTAAEILQSRIISVGRSEAELASVLFNKTGRRRGARFDCLIAATAILANAELATANQSDFKIFLADGLKLALPPI